MSSKNILFYTPFIARSRDAESLMLAFAKQGHRVFSLSQERAEANQDFIEGQHIEAFSHFIDGPRNWWYILKHCLYFIRFCAKHKIDVVYSYLESPSFVSVLSQYLVKARVIICRHHSDMFKFARTGIPYKLTYLLAKRIIVVSMGARKFMIESEGVKASKITVINLAYDFSLYSKVDNDFVSAFSTKNDGNLVLTIIGQLVPIKRTQLAITVTKQLNQSGIKTKLVVVGSGELEEECRRFSHELGILDKVIFVGYVTNVMDYIAASALLLHPSVSESSCVVVKEAALLNKPFIACSGVGDFEEYIGNGRNGYLVDSSEFVSKAVDIITRNLNDPMFGLPESARTVVLKFFGIESILPKYDEFNN